MLSETKALGTKATTLVLVCQDSGQGNESASQLCTSHGWEKLSWALCNLTQFLHAGNNLTISLCLVFGYFFLVFPHTQLIKNEKIQGLTVVGEGSSWSAREIAGLF